MLASTPDRPSLAPERPSSARGRRSLGTRGVLALAGAGIVVMLAAGALSGVISSRSARSVDPRSLRSPAPTGITGVSNRPLPGSTAALMDLRRLPGSPAPAFSLVDQDGRTVSMAQLVTGHAVVLAFLDDRCVGDCPVVAAELAGAARDLGPVARHVHVVAINVDVARNAPGALRRFLAAGPGKALAAVPGFTFLTGSPAALRQLWADFGIGVWLQQGMLVHSEALYFVAPGGAVEYRATPFVDLSRSGTGSLPRSTIRQWAAGIAEYAEATLRRGSPPR